MVSGSESLSAQDARWWKTDLTEEQRGPLMVQVIRQIRQRQSSRYKMDLFHAQLYSDLPIMGFGVNAYTRAISASRVSYNVIQNACDTLQAKITKVRPKVSFLTEGGDYELKHKAEQLEKFLDGVFYETEFFETTPGVVLDACVYGTGVVKVHRRGKRIFFDRVYPFELTVNDSEALYGKPRNYYQSRYYDKLALQAMFPESAAFIEEAAEHMQEMDDWHFGRDESVDQVLVHEGWHLPAGKDSSTGMRILAISNRTLECKPWKDEEPPFVFLHRNKPPFGFWGIGLAQQLAGIQQELNYLVRNVQEAHHLLSKARVFIERGSKVVKTHFVNKIGAFVEYTGTPPVVNAPQAVPPDVYEYIKFLIQSSFEIPGISRLSAQSEKPAGLDSGKALRTYVDIETERFVTFGRNYERMSVQCGKKAIALAKETGSYSVKWSSKDLMETIDWRSIDLNEDKYVMKAYPTSALASAPAMRMQQVGDLVQAGFIEPEMAMELLDFPDTEAFRRRKMAARNCIERNISAMINHGKWVPPEEYDDHALALKLVREAYHEARLNRVPEARQEMLREYMQISHVKLLEEEMKAAPPPPPPGGMPPEGLPPPAGGGMMPIEQLGGAPGEIPQ
jgi:hypothetical protein